VTRASRGSGRVQQACLNVASVVGALAILWFLLSLLLGWSLVLFKTGSMAPTYPTGAAAVAVPVAADEIEPGDVVTVPRAAGGLPVTHRVVSVADPGTGDGARELVLKGDDNATQDLEVYTVTEADRVLVGAPYVGYAVTLLAQPKTLAILTTVVAALTVWVFWPRDEDDADGEPEQTEDGATQGGGLAPAGTAVGSAPGTTRAMLREGLRPPPATQERPT
jgi:signal peptidase